MALAVIATRVALFAFQGGYLAEPARDQELYLRLAGTILDGGGLAFSEDVNLLRHSRADGEGLSGVWAEDPGYVFGLGPVGEPTAMIEPGYPLLLAASMSILGRVSGAVFLPGLLAQIVGAWAAMGLATRLSDRRRGLVAGLLFAIYPYYVFYTANAMTEAIHTAMIPVILLMTVLAMDGRVRPAGAGLATGLLFLVRSTALFILPIQMLFVLNARGWRGATAVLLGFSLCAAPWMARNWIELGSPALLPTKGPLNLWMRNNPGVLEEEGIIVPGDIPINSPGLLEYPDPDLFTTEIERSGELGRRAREFMLENPRLIAWLSVERLASFLSPLPSTPSGHAWVPGALFYIPAACLAGVAFKRFYRRREMRLLLTVFLLYTAMHALGHGGLRYRLPVDSILLVASSIVARTEWRGA